MTGIHQDTWDIRTRGTIQPPPPLNPTPHPHPPSIFFPLPVQFAKADLIYRVDNKGGNRACAAAVEGTEQAVWTENTPPLRFIDPARGDFCLTRRLGASRSPRRGVCCSAWTVVTSLQRLHRWHLPVGPARVVSSPVGCNTLAVGYVLLEETASVAVSFHGVCRVWQLSQRIAHSVPLLLEFNPFA